jgi:hypothetical protein
MSARPRGAALLAAVLVPAVLVPAAAHAAPGAPGQERPAFSFGVIGDVPYGAEDLAQFPQDIASINSDDSLSFVTHVGDIKNGSTVCSDELFAQIRADFELFEVPLVYSPGDNEWTDCHRANNGGYDPLERLDALRKLFFAEPGTTLGERMTVESQAELGFPENVRFAERRIQFAVPHVVGSGNATQPYTGADSATPAQLAEVEARTEASLQLVRDAFADARRQNSRAVVVMLQADMFNPTIEDPRPEDHDAFRPIVQLLAEESAAFDGPVYLFDGDTHVFHEDRPLAPGSEWLDVYGVERPAANLTRVTVDGSGNADNWLKVSVAPNSVRDGEVLTWEQVPLAD